MPRQHQQSAQIAGNKVIRRSGFAQRQKEVVCRIIGTLHPWQPTNNDCSLTKLIDQAPCLSRTNQPSHLLTPGDCTDFVQL